MLKEQADFRNHCNVFSGVPEALTTSEILCHQAARPESRGQDSQKWVVAYHLHLHAKQQQVNLSRRGDVKAKQSSTRNYDRRTEKPHQELEKQAVGLKAIHALTHRRSFLDCLSSSGRKRDQSARKIRDAGAVTCRSLQEAKPTECTHREEATRKALKTAEETLTPPQRC